MAHLDRHPDGHLLKAIAEKRGVDVEFVALAWDRVRTDRDWDACQLLFRCPPQLLYLRTIDGADEERLLRKALEKEAL